MIETRIYSPSFFRTCISMGLDISDVKDVFPFHFKKNIEAALALSHHMFAKKKCVLSK